MDLKALFSTRASRASKAGANFKDCDEAAVNGGALGGMVLFIIGSFLAALLAIQVLADILPDYFDGLGSIFTSLATVNTTGWPPIVATIFGFLPLVLGVIAVAALFGAGALISLNLRKKGA